MDDNLLNQYFSDMRNDGSIVTDVSCGDCAVYLKIFMSSKAKLRVMLKNLSALGSHFLPIIASFRVNTKSKQAYASTTSSCVQ